MSKFGVFIGRFQPFHNGHKAVIDQMLQECERSLVIVGHTGCAPTARNPWSFDEVHSMIAKTYSDHILNPGRRLQIRPLLDNPYDNNAWAKSVRALVKGRHGNDIVTLYGTQKDHTGFYLNLFPEWDRADTGVQAEGIDATTIRRSLLREDANAYAVYGRTPASVIDIISASLLTPRWAGLVAEAAAIKRHHDEWYSEGGEKYGVQHIAVDVVAQRDGDNAVLMIRRGGDVGRGSLALPGGFLDRGERLHEAASRELHEECGIKVEIRPGTGVAFDHPGRSQRGQIVTHAFVIRLTEEQASQVAAGDDAASFEWVRPEDIHARRGEFFSDHFHIVNHLVGAHQYVSPLYVSAITDSTILRRPE